MEKPRGFQQKNEFADFLLNQRDLQLARFLELGFHNILGIEKGKYKDCFPQFAVPPESYKGRFDIPLLVESRIALQRQHQAAGIVEYINTNRISNVTYVPAVSYAINTHDAQRYRPYSVEDALTYFASDEVVSPYIEVLALHLQHPEIFEDHGIDAAGSRSEDVRVPYLFVFLGKPGVGAGWIGSPRSDWGAGSRGNVVTLGR